MQYSWQSARQHFSCIQIMKRISLRSEIEIPWELCMCPCLRSAIAAMHARKKVAYSYFRPPKKAKYTENVNKANEFRDSPSAGLQVQGAAF